MANLKQIRKRIGSVKNTQKITRAMKMVAGARLNRAQQRISALRPYAIKTGEVLASVVIDRSVASADGDSVDVSFDDDSMVRASPLLARRRGQGTLLLVLTSDRGLCGAFNSNINRRAEREWKELEAAGGKVLIGTIGRKGRDYFRRRNAPVFHVFEGIWDKLELETARRVATTILGPFVRGEVDRIVLVYNEFKSAMSQRVVAEQLLPVDPELAKGRGSAGAADTVFEPSRSALLEQLVPMYLEISVLRALYESMASELGARMTAMDSATKNASEMIDRLTLLYNRARQAAITTELMEIIGGAEALNG